MKKVFLFYKEPKVFLLLQSCLEDVCEVQGEMDKGTYLGLIDSIKPDFLVIHCLEDNLLALNVIKELRESFSSFPIIALTDTKDGGLKNKLFQLGVFDIISLSDEDLHLRFDLDFNKLSFFNKQDSERPSVIFKKGPFKIDFEKNTIKVFNDVKKEFLNLDLTHLEFKLLSFLIRNEGVALSRKEIVDYLGDGSIKVSERAVDVHMSALRKKNQYIKKSIKTLYGFGYKFFKAS